MLEWRRVAASFSKLAELGGDEDGEVDVGGGGADLGRCDSWRAGADVDSERVWRIC